MSDTPTLNTKDTYEKMEALLCEMQGLRDELADAKRERDEARAHRDLAVELNDELYTELCGASAERGAALRYIAALEERVDSATLKAAQEAAREEAMK